MDEITQALKAVEAGLPDSADRLLRLVYDELRLLAGQKLAREKSGQTLQPTALVNEAYLRLFGNRSPSQWENRAHFFGAAAEAMRRILIDNARRKNRLKRGGGAVRVDSLLEGFPSPIEDDRLLAIDEALSRFEQEFPIHAGVVKLRFFAGMTNDQAAEVLAISSATAHRYWTFARTWLFAELDDRK